MKFLGTLALASLAVAAPLEKRAVTDADILQFALTLEHLENVFYKKAFSVLSEDAFVAAGFSKDYFSNIKYIAHDEESHVEVLTSALKAAGATPVAACEYDFPMPDVMSFVALSTVLEGVGTSAYLGGAPLISSKDYLTVAGSILVTEALHTSLQRFNSKLIAPANPYGTPLGPNEVFTLAAAFIKSCPASNPPLPFKPFPKLTADTGMPTASGVDFAFSVESAPDSSMTCYLTFISGLATTSVAAKVDGTTVSAPVPDTAMGQTYVVLTNANITGPLSDDMVIAGPAILEVTPPSPTFDDSIM